MGSPEYNKMYQRTRYWYFKAKSQTDDMIEIRKLMAEYKERYESKRK